jgi:hypothetical protein
LLRPLWRGARVRATGCWALKRITLRSISEVVAIDRARPICRHDCLLLHCDLLLRYGPLLHCLCRPLPLFKLKLMLVL